MKISIAYGDPQQQVVWETEVASGTTLGDALQDPGISQRLADAGSSQAAVGIWGKVRPMNQVLREGDRIELYRPLLADPKAARRKRAAR